METKSLAMGEAIRYGWNTMKQHIGFFILFLLMYMAIYIGTSVIFAIVSGDNAVVYFIGNIILMVFDVFLSLGLIRVTLSIIDNKKPDVKELFAEGQQLLDGVILTVLYGLIVLGGTLLFIIPGIIWSIKYSQSFYLLVDKKMKPMEALKQSGLMMEGVKMEYLGYSLLYALIIIAGVLALIVGLFAAVPTTMMAGTWIYRRLLNQTNTPAATSMPMPPKMA
ncbi:MAG: hypothetical protein KBD15_02550 [Candidatus Magasanikbacteria bacterium]|jgi:uncharacterized membrane protein|nr:hypothetical protein [Candidatus Magasanikbacteria bacterium]